MKTLPDKLSDLVDLALEDLALVERDKRYRVDMNVWHQRMPGSRCHVCFAGAVMAGTLGADINARRSALDFDEETQVKLFALDAVRNGDVIEALEEYFSIYDGEAAWPHGDLEIAPYQDDAGAWWASMKFIAAELRIRGL